MTGTDPQLPDRWAAVASDLCAAVEAAWETFGRPDRKPAVRVRHGTIPAYDQVDVVYVSLARVLPVTDRNARCAIWPRARFQIELVRGWPTDISLEHDTAAAAALVEDATIVWYTVAARCAEATLFPSVPALDCHHVTVGDLTPVEPQGGVAGWRFPIDVDLML